MESTEWKYCINPVTLLGTKASALGGLVRGLIKLSEEAKSDAKPVISGIISIPL